MQIDTRYIGNHSILALHGRLVLGKDLIELRNAVHDAAEKNPEKITLNLANVTYIDSCGIGELVNTFTYIRNRGTRLAMINLPQMIRILLDTAQLTKVLGIPDSEKTPNIISGQQMPLHPPFN